MIRRIAASLAALIAASILIAPAADAREHQPAPEPSLARHIDWD